MKKYMGGRKNMKRSEYVKAALTWAVVLVLAAGAEGWATLILG